MQNGKVDRGKLKEIDIDEVREDILPPENHAQKELLAIWRGILDTKQIGIDSNFFNLGGDSILAILMLAKLDLLYMDLKTVYRYPTIRQIGDYITSVSGQAGRNVVRLDDVVRLAKRNVSIDCADEADTDSGPSEEGIIALDRLLPFRHLFHKSCFFNSFFPIIQYYGISPLYFLIGDLPVYSLMTDDGLLNWGVNFNQIGAMDDIFDRFGIMLFIKTKSEDILKDIEKALANGQPSIVYIDCYYEPIRPDMYQKSHWPHTLLICGLDKRENELLVIEHDEVNSLKYEKRNCTAMI